MRYASNTILFAVVLAVAFAFAGGDACNAQCPGGTCPTTYVPSQVVRSGHWSYPGPSIQDHLASSHGFDASGMSLEQALTKHDELHERSRESATLLTRTTVRYQRKSLLSRFRLRR